MDKDNFESKIVKVKVTVESAVVTVADTLGGVCSTLFPFSGHFPNSVRSLCSHVGSA